MGIVIYSALFGWPSSSIFALLLIGIVLIDYVSYSFPIPGGAGVREATFILYFGSVVFVEPQVFVAAILWTIAVFIIPIINGMPVVIHEAISSARAKKKGMVSSDEGQG